MNNLSGQTIKGYELVERIGAGGFGAVYRAKQTTVDREVAVKVILPGLANNPEFIRRFETEAHLVARLEHLHIVPLHDFWRDPDGAYLVMRYLRGGSLHDMIKQGALSLEECVHIIHQIASALTNAHDNGIIHRDIKPANILLDEDGNAYLSDFGIAKNIDDPTSSVTDVDTIVGTSDYLSPEQARSEPVTARTDIYSLGVTLYEMITGEHPFKDASTVERIFKHINDPLPQITGLDPELTGGINMVISKATEKNPSYRYSDVMSMALEFSHAAAISERHISTSLIEQLTPREIDILKLLIEGMTNREIAHELFITESTVKWYNQQIYGKLGVRSRTQAVARVRELNLFGQFDANEQGEESQGISSLSLLLEPDNPYKGLYAFEAADRSNFFGRELLIDKLLTRMDEDVPMSRFLAVVGPSGSGKSSLVKAGLIPALWDGKIAGSEDWYVVEFMPGIHPIDQLEITLLKIAANQASNLRDQLDRDERGLVRVADLILPDNHSKLVVFIDQFEEVFTLVEDESERQHMLDLLYTAVTDNRSRVCVITTLRADYYDRPLAYPEFGEMLRNRMETLLPLSAKQLEQAVRAPAERVHVAFEESLVAQIVSEMTYQAGALPLLQYGLTELFEKREGLLLTHQAYHDIGGAVGALARRAEEIYQELNDESQEAIAQIFIRLVTLGEGAEDTRRRVNRSELLAISESSDMVEEIIDTFAEYRLLSLDNHPATRIPTVEVAHEAILREWERLRNWLNESRADIRLQRQLSHMADEWRNHQHDQSYLLRGSRLDQFEGWTKTTGLALTQIERDFLHASLQSRIIEEQEKQSRKAYEEHLEQRSQKILRTLVGVFALAAIVGIGLSIFSFIQSNEAMNARATTEAIAVDLQQNLDHQEALNLFLQAQEAANANHPELALALAYEAANHPQSQPEAVRFVAELAQQPGVTHLLEGHTDEVTRVMMMNENGKRASVPTHILSSSRDATLRLWQITSSEEVMRYNGHTDEIVAFDLDPSTKLILSVGKSDGFMLWDRETGNLLNHIQSDKEAHRVKFIDKDTAFFFSVDRGELSRGWVASELTIRDVHTGDITLDFSNIEDGLVVKDWNYNVGKDRLVAVYGKYPSVEGLGYFDYQHQYAVWQLSTGELIHSQSAGLRNYELLVSPDFDLHEVGFNVDLTPNGKQALISFHDNCSLGLIVIDTETGTRGPIVSGSLLPPSFGGQKKSECVLIRAISNNLALATPIRGVGPAFLFDIEQEAYITTLRETGYPIMDSQLGYVVFASRQEEFVLQDTNQWRNIIQVSSGGIPPLTSVDIAPRHSLLAIGHLDGTIRVWSWQGQDKPHHVVSNPSPLTDLTVSPDGTTILSAGFTLEISLYDLATGDLIRTFEGHESPSSNPGWVWDIKFSSDGQTAISAGSDGTVIKWDINTGDMIFQTEAMETDAFSLAYSSDEQSIFVGYSNPFENTTFSMTEAVAEFNAETGELIRWINLPDSVKAWGVGSIAVNPDGNLLATGVSFQGDSMAIIDLTNNEVIHTIDYLTVGIMEGLAFTADGQSLLTSGEGYGLALFDVESGDLLRSFKTDAINNYHQFALSPDGRLVAVALGGFEDTGGDKEVVIWDVESGAEEFRLIGHTNWIRAVDFHPDGNQIVSGGGDSKIRVWNLQEITLRQLEAILQNRYIPEFTCEQRIEYRIEPYCSD